MVARKKRVLHSELGLFGYLWYSCTGTFTSTVCTNANHFLYKCFIISCACLQHTAPLQQQKVQQQRPSQPKKTHTNLYACAHTHTNILQPGSQKILHKAYFGRVSRTGSSERAGCCVVMPLIRNEAAVCVHPQFASTQHPVHLSGNETAVTLIRFLLPNLKEHLNCWKYLMYICICFLFKIG